MNPAPLKWVREFFWTHPEWWTLVLSATAWALILVHAIAQQGHAHGISFPNEFLAWGLMVVAMMLPLVLVPLRWLAFQSFRYRRHQAVLGFLIGFLVPWMLLGLVTAWVQTLDWSYGPLFASALFLLAALWVLVPIRRRALLSCHRTVPLAPSGWQADRDCVQYGLFIGSSCLLTCGFLMVACAVTGHNLIAMLAGVVIGGLEYYSYRPPNRVLFAASVLLAVLFLPMFSSTLIP